MSHRVLVQWIGHSDLRALARDLSAADQQKVLSHVKDRPADSGDDGPTRTLLRQQSFDEVRLLSNYPPEINRWFVDWIALPASVIEVSLANPTDYKAIYEIADRELREVQKRHSPSRMELCLHLSPGTPAMAAV